MGRLAVYAAGEVGCRKLSATPPPPSARDRAGVGYSASILQVPLSPIPPKGQSAGQLQTGTTVSFEGFEGFEGGERGALSNDLKPMWLKCLCSDTRVARLYALRPKFPSRPQRATIRHYRPGSGFFGTTRRA
jgi:hypothetical protein